jgi:hypothetical protein
MDRGTVLLQGLRNNLRGWTDRIRRATYATDVTFTAQPDGEFTVRVEWTLKDGQKKYFDKTYTRREVFGLSYSGHQHGWRIQRKVCDYAKELMRDVLNARGV